jgi:hypothetical protein
MAKQKTKPEGAGGQSAVIEQIPTAELVPYARNSRTHSDEQVAQIAASIREFGFCNPVLIDEKGTIIAGHGRVMAATRMKLEAVPCLRLSHLTDAQKRAYVIADNRIALSSGWDTEMLANELSDLHADEFDMALLGFDADELAKLLELNGDELPAEPSGSNEAVEGESPYTNKTASPIYEPKGDCPSISELADRSRTQQLQSEIELADIPEGVKTFLTAAAQRHTVFNFRNIAEFYCHASAEVQHLMERSGLIIIDFNKAIEI